MKKPTYLNKSTSPLAVFMVGVVLLIVLVFSLSIIDIRYDGISYNINIYGRSDNVMLLALVICMVLVILTLIALKVILGSPICHKCIISKKFVSTDDTIIDGTNGEKIRFKDGDRTEPVEVEIQESVLSTSKTIALIGSIAILLLFMSFGAVTIAKYLYIGTVPYGQMSKILHFLLGGSVLFVPYIINKIFNAGRSLTKRK